MNAEFIYEPEPPHEAISIYAGTVPTSVLLLCATAAALCAMADKMADKLKKSSGCWRRCNDAHA